MHKNLQGGFTVIELLVVILIIGILVAITLPNLLGLQRRARDDARKNDLRVIQAALESFYVDKINYPDSNQGLGLLQPAYLNQIPVDPNGGSYSYNSTGTSFTLIASLENSSDPQANNGIYTLQSINH